MVAGQQLANFRIIPVCCACLAPAAADRPKGQSVPARRLWDQLFVFVTYQVLAPACSGQQGGTQSLPGPLP